MQRLVILALFLLILLAGIIVGRVLLNQGNNPGTAGNGANNAAPASLPSVQITPNPEAEINQPITAYGTVVFEPGSEKRLSVGFKSRVVTLDAVMGLRVYPDQPLLSVQASPAELLNLAQAETAVKTAEAQLQQVKENLATQSATQQSLVAAQGALNTAQLKLKSMQDLGIGSTVTLRAAEDSLVGDLPIAPGQIIPAGTMLIGLLPENKILVKLSVSPSDARQLKPGQSAMISVTSQGSALNVPGIISTISSQADPATGFLRVYVKPDKPNGLLIGQYVSCELYPAGATSQP